jgi:hypothetical protein
MPPEEREPLDSAGPERDGLDSEKLHNLADTLCRRILDLAKKGKPTDYKEVMMKAMDSDLPDGSWLDYVEAWDYLYRLGIVSTTGEPS